MSKTRTLKAVARRLGFDVFRYGISRFRVDVVGNMHYAPIRPLSTYSPWLDDKTFLALHDAISAHTLVDVYRCFELWELVAQTAKLPGDIVEVGVWRGGTGALLAARAKEAGKRAYLCDTFTGIVKATQKDTTYRGNEHANTSEDTVKSLVDGLGLDNVKIMKGVFPEDVAEQLENQTFCFAHIDVDVYQSAKEVLEFVWPRVPIGGIVVFDDYGFVSCDGIPKLIAEHRRDPDKVIVHNLNGHAVLVKTS